MQVDNVITLSVVKGLIPVSFCDHLIGPGPFLAAMVVKRRSDLAHELLLCHAANKKLEEGRTTVENKRQADDNVRERVSGSHCEEREENTDRL